MKKILVFTALFFLSYFVQAQINVGPSEKMKMKGGTFNPQELELLKATTTVFVCDEKNEDKLEELETAIKEAWNFTKIKVISNDELNDYDGTNKYSYFTVIKDVTTVTNSKTGFTSTYTHYYLSLWMNNKVKNKEKVIKFGRIELFPAFASTNNGNLTFYNWNTGFVKGYLGLLNEHLVNGKTRWLIQSEENKVAIANLKKDTLYVPDYILIKFNAFTGDESKKFEPNEFFKSYPYPYKIVSSEVLSNKILSASKPLNYLVYTKSSTDKYISVYNTKSGLIYSKYKPTSYNVKTKDFSALASKVGK